MVSLQFAVIFLLTLTACGGHVCLLSPVQRAGFTQDLNKKGSDDCIRLSGPCGGIQPETPPKTAISGGTNITVIWQKNLDHYNKYRAGYFSVKIGRSMTTLTEVTRVPDDYNPSLSLYTTTIPHPATAGYYVIQVMYYTNNPDAPPAFYQCADVIVFPPIKHRLIPTNTIQQSRSSHLN